MRESRKKRIVLIDWVAGYIKTISALESVEIAMAVVDDEELAKRCQQVAGGKIAQFYYMRFASEADFMHRNESNYNLTYTEIHEYSTTQLNVEHYLHRELHNDAEIQHRYFVALRFWLDFFSKEKIDMVFATDAEHGGIWDTIIFDVAKKYNIPVYVPGLQCPSGNGYITTMRDRNAGQCLDVSRAGFKSIESCKVFNRLTDYTRQFKKAAIYKRRRLGRLFSMRLRAMLKNMQTIWGTQKNPDGDVYQCVGTVKRSERYNGYVWIANLRNYYDVAAERANYEENYIYYPLHQEPEASIMVQADLASQLTIIGWIAQSLPEGWYLYVKEHPSSFSCYEQERQFYINIKWYKDPRFYSVIKRYPRVKLISMDDASDELIAHSRAVASICGTALTEAIVCNKPILVFGQGISWYEHLKDALCIDSIRSLQMAMKWLQNRPVPDYEDINEVINRYAFYDESSHGVGNLLDYSEVKARLIRFLLQQTTVSQ